MQDLLTPFVSLKLELVYYTKRRCTAVSTVVLDFDTVYYYLRCF